MYRDDRLEFKKGSLLVKKTETTMDTGEDGNPMQKQRRSTKFDFSGTNYEVVTFGYLAGIEDEHKIDPNLFKNICDKAQKASSTRKPVEIINDKYSSIRSDPAFLARASLRARILGRAIGNDWQRSDGEETGEDLRLGRADEVPADGGNENVSNEDADNEDADKEGKEQLLEEIYNEDADNEGVDKMGFDSEGELTSLEDDENGRTDDGSQA
jgi:hypothetical protein